MTPSFSIVIPTCGRESLLATLASVTPQLESGDEVIISRLDCNWGHEARDLAIPRCAGSHLLFIDDDDVYLPFALGQIRVWVEAEPERVHFFRMTLDNGLEIVPEWPLRQSTIGTPMWCVPNDPEKLGKWGSRYEGDFDFIEQTMELRGDEPVIHERALSLIRPRVWA